MHIHFEPITSQNREIALNLKIADSQHGFIESVQQCLSEADRCKRWHPVGIYDGDTMVGFAMYGFFRSQTGVPLPITSPKTRQPPPAIPQSRYLSHDCTHI